MRRRSSVRARWTASGFTSLPISCAMSASLGRVMTSAAKAGSLSASLSMKEHRADENAPTVSSAREPSFESEVSSLMATVCAACQRLKASVSCRRRTSSSSFGRSRDIFTGAENPRKSDGTGRDVTPVKVMLSAALSNRNTPRSFTRSQAAFTGDPSCETRPSTTGMAIGSFFACPGVGGVLWVKSRR